MSSWCTPDDVRPRLAVGPDVALGLLQEYCEQATSTLYMMSGRRFAGESRVTADLLVLPNGRIRVSDWNPVRALVSVFDGSVPVTGSLSPAGAFVSVPTQYAYRTLTLTMDVGQDPPSSGKRAAAALAAEMLREDPRYAMMSVDGAPPKDIRTGSRVTSITRQGKTVSFVSPIDLARENLTGIMEVDLFLRAVNPKGAQYQPKVVS